MWLGAKASPKDPKAFRFHRAPSKMQHPVSKCVEVTLYLVEKVHVEGSQSKMPYRGLNLFLFATELRLTFIVFIRTCDRFFIVHAVVLAKVLSDMFLD